MNSVSRCFSLFFLLFMHGMFGMVQVELLPRLHPATNEPLQETISNTPLPQPMIVPDDEFLFEPKELIAYCQECDLEDFIRVVSSQISLALYCNERVRHDDAESPLLDRLPSSPASFNVSLFLHRYLLAFDKLRKILANGKECYAMLQDFTAEAASGSEIDILSQMDTITKKLSDQLSKTKKEIIDLKELSDQLKRAHSTLTVEEKE